MMRRGHVPAALCVLALGALPCLTGASPPPPRRLRHSEAEDCSQTPGTKPGHYIVGEKAWRYFADRNETHLVTKGWNKHKPIRVQKGCAFNYRLHFGDEVHIVVEKEHELSEMWFQYDQEKQPGATQYQSMIWFVAWEKFMQHYNRRFGGIPYAMEWGYIVYLDASEVAFKSDQVVEHVGEQRHDIYHMRNQSARWFKGKTYQKEEHVGDLRVCLYANHRIQMQGSIYPPSELVFMGSNTWHEHPPTGKILQSQYDALKAFYQATCAPYRGASPPAYDMPWKTTWTREFHLENVSFDYDYMPYCTWLLDGWNDSYWSRHLSTSGGACHMIEGIWCDGDGYIDEVSLPHKGLQGNLGHLLENLTSLRVLNVNSNMLSGTIPSFLQNASELQQFSIWHNIMSGTVPCFNSNVLWRQDLSYNHLQGSLPNCPHGEDVFDVYLEHNDLNGTIPKEWKGYVNFRVMWFTYNRVSGPIPHEICNLTALMYLGIEGNLLTGSIPDDCLANPRHTEGLFQIHHIDGSHNRFTGPLPRVNGNKALDKISAGGWLHFNHNYFSGTYDGQWDEFLLHKPEGSVWFARLWFKDNLLSGPLPEFFRTLAMRHSGDRGKAILDWKFQNNYFRCERDGRWPHWVNRRVDTWLNQGIGKCLPVAHPQRVPPDDLVQGQVAMLTVYGSDFIARGSQRCKFTSTLTGTAMVTTAIRETDRLIRCLVPADLSSGDHRVQVSNFGEDWSSAELIEGYVADPTITVVDPPISSYATHLNVTMILVTNRSSDSQHNETIFDDTLVEAMIGSLFSQDLEVSNVKARLYSPVGSSTVRRLQLGGDRILVLGFHVSVPPAEPDEVEDEEDRYNKVKGMKARLEDRDLVEQAFKEIGNIVVTIIAVSVKGLIISDAAGDEKEDGVLTMVLLIVAAVTILIACSLCGFVVFLFRMERQGQGYFLDTLDDEFPEPEVVMSTADVGCPQKVEAQKIGVEYGEGIDI